ILRAFGPLAVANLRDHERDRCEASPETWAYQLQPGNVSYAYDPATLLSRNAAAPPLDPDLFETIVKSPDPPVAVNTTWPLRGGKVVVRIAPSGPCAIVQTTFSAQYMRTQVVSNVLVGTLAIIMLAAALGFVAIVRPLTKRVDRVRR